MATAVVGYSLPVPRLSPRVYLEFDYASGDKKPGGDVGTFNQLFPNAHSFLGYIDYIGRQNIISPNAGLTMRSEEHTSELQSLAYLVCRLLLEKKKKNDRI